jgi:CheY-like chemotaxis protein
LPLGRPRIFLADDHPDFLTIVGRLIETEFEVIQTFRDGQAIVDAVDALDADLLVVDISMPRLSGLDDPQG